MRYTLPTVALISALGLTHATPTRLGLLTPTKKIESRSWLPSWLDSRSEQPRALVARQSIKPGQAGYTQSLHQGDGGNADGDEVNANYFQIPNTRTQVNLYLSTIGLAPAQMEILNATNTFIQAQLAASGDGQLPQAVDPLYYDYQNGAFVQCSSDPGQHLTWGILGAVMPWLYKHLGEASQYRHVASAAIHDSDWGVVGMCMVSFGYTGTAVPQVVQGPAGVTNYG